MPSYTYLIVGGGMAAHAAVDGIRQNDENGSIGILTAESMIPYDRPPLSKGLWTSDEMNGEDVLSDVLKRGDVEVHVDTRITHLDPQAKRVTSDDAIIYEYDKLLLATGSQPRQLPFDDGTYDIIYFRTLRDYYTLRNQARENRRIGVIGGGFIGSELAAALTGEGNQVTMFFPEAGIVGEVLPAEISQHMNALYASKGVEVLNERLVTTIEYNTDRDTYTIVTDKADRVEVDLVVAGIGVQPNTALAEDADLAVDDGIRVNAQLQTSNAHIYAAGDVARFYNPALDEWIRVEHEDNATTQGELAGRNMAGAAEEYTYTPFFYSDMFDMGYEAVGKLNSDLTTTITWRDEDKARVIYRDDAGIVRGVLMWNIFGELSAARDLLGEPLDEAVSAEG